MGNGEDTDELIGKTGSGNTIGSAAKDMAAVERGKQKKDMCIFLLCLLMHPSAKIMKRAVYGGPKVQDTTARYRPFPFPFLTVFCELLSCFVICCCGLKSVLFAQSKIPCSIAQSDELKNLFITKF